MVTNHAHRTASHASARPAMEQDGGGGVGVLQRVRQWMCGLHGHDRLLQFERDRMFLQCVSCGHQSPGWLLTEARPTLRLRGDARRQVLVRPHLVGARRIA